MYSTTRASRNTRHRRRTIKVVLVPFRENVRGKRPDIKCTQDWLLHHDKVPACTSAFLNRKQLGRGPLHSALVSTSQI